VASLTFKVKTSFVLSWTLTDAQGNPIDNANVSATLYSGRSQQNPETTPGTAVAPLNPLALDFVSNGLYSADVPATLDPPVDGTPYILVVDGTVSAIPVYHDEQPVAIMGVGNAIDLTTLDAVKNWIPGLDPNTASDDDVNLQSIITAWSYEFLNRTGLGDQNGDFTQSPFVQICEFKETYDGSGTLRLFLKNRPIRSVIGLSVNGVSVTASTSPSQYGYVIDGNGKSIALRQGLSAWASPGPSYGGYQSGPFRKFSGLRFYEGIQNIYVDYTAGYNQTPHDIEECAKKVVHQNYKRPSWVDEMSRALAGGGGTIRYRDWDLPPECCKTVERYTRTL
jgi:hypothetical protein